jgi:hypothetical protein
VFGAAPVAGLSACGQSVVGALLEVLRTNSAWISPLLPKTPTVDPHIRTPNTQAGAIEKAIRFSVEQYNDSAAQWSPQLAQLALGRTMMSRGRLQLSIDDETEGPRSRKCPDWHDHHEHR